MTLATRLLVVASGCAPSLSDARAPSGDAAMDAGAAATIDAGAEVLGTAGADGGAGDGSEGPNGLTAPDVAGTWSGSSSQGEPITLTIEPAGWTGWEFGWLLPNCGSAHRATFPPTAIVAGTVTRSIPAGRGALSVAMTIAFSDTSSATGSIEFSLVAAVAGGCAGSGTATFSAARDP